MVSLIVSGVTIDATRFVIAVTQIKKLNSVNLSLMMTRFFQRPWVTHVFRHSAIMSASISFCGIYRPALKKYLTWQL